MKIEDLYIEGFGPFASKQVGPFTGSIIVIHGDNEAGKSTLLAFIRMVLFGFPRQKSSDHYPPFAGGQHGGRLSMVDDAGNRYIVERFRGTRGGPVSMMTSDGAPVDEGNLGRLLGGASSGLFKDVFAFSLDELQAEKQLQDADVNSQIYSAGMGAANLPQALKTIRDKKTDIFRRQGSKNVIADLIAKLEEVGRGLDEAEGNAEKYGNHVARLSEIGRQLGSMEAERARLHQQSGEISRLRQGWDDWVPLVDVEETLAKLPRFEGFPENGIVRLEHGENQVEDARQELDDTKERVKHVDESAQTIFADEVLLDNREAIEHIRRGRNRFDDSIKDLPERKTELQSLENSLGERLRDIGQEWDEERLISFDTSMVTRDHIEQVRQDLAGKVVDVQQLAGQLDLAKGDLLEREEAEKQARENTEELGEPTLDAAALEEKRSALRTTRTRFEEFARLRLRHSDLRDQLRLSTGQTAVESRSSWIQGRGLSILLGVAAIVLIAVSAVLGQQSLFIGGIGAALLLIIVIYIYLNAGRGARGGSSLGNQALLNNVSRADKEETEAEQRLREVAAALGLDLPDAVALDDAESELSAADAANRAWGSIQQRLAEATEARQQLNQR